jgi:hypothetical protein
MFPHTSAFKKSSKNLLICFHERKIQKSTPDINAINLSQPVKRNTPTKFHTAIT